MSSNNHPSMGLRKRILYSVKLSSLQFISQIGFRLVSTIVLTRLFAPEVYGIFAVVLLYRYLLEMFSDLGIRSVVLTKEGDIDPSFLKTCWTVSIIRGCVILVVSGLIALFIAWLQAKGTFSEESAYAASVLPWAIAALGGVSLVSGLQTTNLYVYERNMAFGHVTIGIILSNAIGLVSTIILAWWLRSVWALVMGAYIQTVTFLVYSFLVFKGPAMGVSFDPSALKIIIARGKWIMGHSSLTVLSGAADRLVLGFFMDASMFGFYFIARQVVEMGSGFLNTIHSRIGLQVFTQIMNTDAVIFRTKYYSYRFFFDALAGLGAGCLFVIAPKLIKVMYDSRYLPVGEFVQLLVFSLLLIGALILREAFSAERKFREMTLLSLVSTVTLWAGLLLMVWLDSISGALLVIALHRLPEAIILYWLAAGRTWLVPWRETLVIGFFGVGAAAGWLLLELEQVIT